MGNLITGPVSEKSKPINEDEPKTPLIRNQMRSVEIYTKDPPSHEGKIEMVFPIERKCGVQEGPKKCDFKLMVLRVKNTKLERDSTGQGGQLVYDENDVHQYIYCPLHGPDPPGPESWK